MNLEQDYLIKYERPIKKVVDHKFQNQRSQEQILLEILQETYNNGPNSSPDLQTLLNIMLPPLEFKNEEGEFISYVSSKPSVWEDIVNLQQRLEADLKNRRAKTKGICAIREDLFMESFNELLRQITIDCPQRGLLLLRVWDEFWMTLDSYKILYKEADTFGEKILIEAQQNKKHLQEELQQLEQEKKQLENQLSQIQMETQVFQDNFDSKISNLRKLRKQEIDFLEQQNSQLRQFFQSLENQS